MLSLLTTRELQIAKTVAQGLSNKQVCRALKLSEGTVKIHLHNIYQKLNIPSRSMLTLLIVRSQMEKPQDALPNPPQSPW